MPPRPAAPRWRSLRGVAGVRPRGRPRRGSRAGSPGGLEARGHAVAAYVETRIEARGCPRCSQATMDTLDSGSPGQPGRKSGWEATVDATLRRLGVPLEASVRGADTAGAQGFAPASVVLGHRVLEGGNPGQAIAAFDGAMLSLLGGRRVNPAPLLGVAPYPRRAA